MNLGRDADTVGAIYGQLAGAFYGAGSIPEDWKKKCSLCSLIELFASELVSLGENIPAGEKPLPDSTDWDSDFPPLAASQCMYVYVKILLSGLLRYGHLYYLM